MANQSWRTYGGINKTERMNYITTKSIIANNLSTKEAYVGNYDICGALFVSNDSILSQNATVGQDLYIGGNTHTRGNTDISMNLIVDGNTLLNSDVQINGNVHISRRLDVSKNAIIEGSMNVYNQLYIGNPNSAPPLYLYGSNSCIGLNTMTPQATVDISGANETVLNVSSSSVTTTNILARNKNNHGIVLTSNDTSSAIQYYNDSAIGSGPNAQIVYTAGGQLSINVSNNTTVGSQLVVSNRQDTAHVLNETAIIYDISAGPYLPNYYTENSYNTGNALTLISNNSGSNTFLNIITPDQMGLAVGGGIFPSDTGRSMGVIGLFDNCGNTMPVQTIVSGNIDVLQRSTVGINKYNPITEKYVLDINGPVHIDNGGITNVYNPVYTIRDIARSSLQSPLCVSVGQNNINYSNNGGKTWHTTPIPMLEGNIVNLYAVSVYDSSYAIIGGNSGYVFYTNNGGITWTRLIGFNETGIDIMAINIYLSNASSGFINIVDTSNNVIFYNFTAYDVININSTSKTVINFGGSVTINSISNTALSSSAEYVWYAGYNSTNYGFIGMTPNRGSARTYTSSRANSKYNSIKTIFDSVYITIAVGNGIISSYTFDSITPNTPMLFTDSSTNIFTNIIFNDVYIYNRFCAVAVGNSAAFYYMADGSTWNPVPVQFLNSSGIASTLCDTSNNFTGIYMNSIDEFVITSVRYDGSSNIYYCHLPHLFNSKHNNVFDVCGNMQVTGDLTVDYNVYIKENLEVDYDSSLNGNVFIGKQLKVTLDTNLNSNLIVGNNTNISGNLTVIRDVSFSANLRVGNNTNISGNLTVIKDVSMNANLHVGNNTNISGNLFVLMDVSLNSNLLVGNTVNILGNLMVVQDVSLNSNLLVINTVNVLGNLFVLKDVSLNSNLLVSNAINVLGNLMVNRDVFLNSNLLVGNTVNVLGNLIVVQDVSLNSNLLVGNAVNVSGNLMVNLDVSLNSNLLVGNNTYMLGNLMVNLDVSLNSNLLVGNNTNILGNLMVSNDVSLNSNLLVGNTVNVLGNLMVNRDVSLNSNLLVGNTVNVLGNLAVSSDVSLNSNLIVGNNAQILGNLAVANNTQLSGQFNVVQDGHMNANLIVDGLIKTNNITNNTNGPIRISSNTIDISGTAINIAGDVNNDNNIYIGSFIDVSAATNPCNLTIYANMTVIGAVTFKGTNTTQGIATNSQSVLQLNHNSDSTSAGGGIQICDFSNNAANQLLVSADRKGYNLKTAGSNNKLNLDLSKLNLTDNIVTIKQSLLDASYSMVSSNTNINNILLRDGSNSSLSLQTISTDLTIRGNTYSTGFITNKSTINPNMNMDISGNATITRLGLNTASIDNDATLTLTGNIRINSGGYILQF